MERDKKWSCFEGIEKEFDAYAEKAAANMFLKPEISDDISQSFRVIKRLLQCSFYEYEFYDIAAFQSLVALEMAFRIRYKEVKGEDCPKNKNLQDLFEMFYKMGYMEIYDTYILDHIRSVRNSMTHRKTHGFGGPNSRQWVDHSIDLINDLYEDVEKRKKRVEKTIQLDNIFRTFSKEGCIITIRENKSFFVYDLSILFFDNKSTPNKISIYCMPTFDIPVDKSTKGYPPYIPVEIQDYQFLEGIFYGIVDDKVYFIVEPIANVINRDAYDNWIAKYKTFNDLHMCDVLNRSQIGHLYNEKRRDFHKR